MNIGGSCHGCETSIRAIRPPTQVCRRRVRREIGAEITALPLARAPRFHVFTLV